MDLNTLLNLLNQGTSTGASPLAGSGTPINPLFISTQSPQSPQSTPLPLAPSRQVPLGGSADIYHNSEVPTSPSLLAASGVSAYVHLLGALSAAGSHETSANLMTRSLMEASAALKSAYHQATAKLSPQLQAKDWRFTVSNGRLVFTKGQNELSPHDVVELRQAFARANVELPAKQVAAAMTSMQSQRNAGSGAGSLAWGRFEVDETNFGRVVDLRAYVTATAPAGEYNPDAANQAPNGQASNGLNGQALNGQSANGQTANGGQLSNGQLPNGQMANGQTSTLGNNPFGAPATAAGANAFGPTGAGPVGQSDPNALVQTTTGSMAAGQSVAGQLGASQPGASQTGTSQLASNPTAAHLAAPNSANHSDIPLTLGGMYLGDLVTSKPDFFKSDSAARPEALLAIEAPRHVEAGAILQGRCSCGEVRFTVEDEVEYAFYCHCTRCRLRTGSVFAAIAAVGIDKVEVTAGDKSLLIEGECSDGYGARCSQCHTFLFAAVRGRQYLHISLGALAGAPSRVPDRHIYVGSKAPWYQITDGLPQYEELPEVG